MDEPSAEPIKILKQPDEQDRDTSEVSRRLKILGEHGPELMVPLTVRTLRNLHRRSIT